MFNCFIAFFILDHLNNNRDDALGFKARAFALLWLSTTLLIWGYVAFSYYFFDESAQVVTMVGLLCGILHTATPILFRYTQSFPCSALNLSLTSLVFQVTFCIYSGWVHSPVAIWLSIHPIILGFFSSVRCVVLAVVLNMLVLLVMVLMEYSGYLPVSILPDVRRDILLVSSYFGLNMLIGFLTIMAIKFNQNKNIALTQARELSESLVRILCHDLNNPLVAIRYKLHAAQRDGSVQSNANLLHIQHAVDDIQNIIDSVRTWCGYSSGKVDLNMTRFTLAELVTYVEQRFLVQMQKKCLCFKVIGDIEQTVFADKSALLYQVMGNVMSNAIKFSFEGQIITLSFVATPSHIMIEVRDEGVGIEPSRCKDVLSPYIRTSEFGTKNEKGIGFGLPIAAIVLKHMGGDIALYNRHQLGESASGTLVCIRLPNV